MAISNISDLLLRLGRFLRNCVCFVSNIEGNMGKCEMGYGEGGVEARANEMD